MNKETLERAREAAQQIINAAAVAEEHGDLTALQQLAQSNALLQQQVCNAFECITILHERIDTLEGDLNRYRAGEL